MVLAVLRITRGIDRGWGALLAVLRVARVARWADRLVALVVAALWGVAVAACLVSSVRAVFADARWWSPLAWLVVSIVAAYAGYAVVGRAAGDARGREEDAAVEDRPA